MTRETKSVLGDTYVDGKSLGCWVDEIKKLKEFKAQQEFNTKDNLGFLPCAWGYYYTTHWLGLVPVRHCGNKCLSKVYGKKHSYMPSPRICNKCEFRARGDNPETN